MTKPRLSRLSTKFGRDLQRGVAVLQRSIKVADDGAHPAAVVQRFRVLRIEPDRGVEIHDGAREIVVLGVELAAPVECGGIVRIGAELAVEVLDRCRVLGRDCRGRREVRPRVAAVWQAEPPRARRCRLRRRFGFWNHRFHFRDHHRPRPGVAGAAAVARRRGSCGSSRGDLAGLPRRTRNPKPATTKARAPAAPASRAITPIRVRLKTSSAVSSGDPELADQFVDKQTMLAAGIVDDGARRRGIHHQRAGRSIDGSKARGHRAKAPLERISPRRIENGDLDPGAPRVHFLENCIQADAVAPHVGLGPDLSVNRDDIALPGRLDGVAAEEHQRDRARRDLAVEAIERAAAFRLWKDSPTTSTSNPTLASLQALGQARARPSTAPSTGNRHRDNSHCRRSRPAAGPSRPAEPRRRAPADASMTVKTTIQSKRMVMLRNFLCFPGHVLVAFAYRNRSPKASGRAVDKPAAPDRFEVDHSQIRFQKQ